MVKKATAKKPELSQPEPTVFESLESIQFDFDCGVAVWLAGLKTMSSEVILFMNLKAMDYGCVSQCPKYRLNTAQIGVIYLFENKECALQFCEPLRDVKSPHGDYPFVAEHLGTYLRIVAEIEEKIPDVHDTPETKIIVRNLDPTRRVLKRMASLCAVFGKVLKYEEYQDVGSNFEFRHVVVSYRYAVQAFAAKLALDGKWIYEQMHPLAVEVDPDSKVKYIYAHLLKLNKLLFQY